MTKKQAKARELLQVADKLRQAADKARDIAAIAEGMAMALEAPDFARVVVSFFAATSRAGRDEAVEAMRKWLDAHGGKAPESVRRFLEIGGLDVTGMVWPRPGRKAKR